MDVPKIAARQGGVFTADQAVAAGWSARQVRRRIAAGRWVYVAGRALAAPADAWTPFQLAMAAHLTWSGVVVSHQTAAGLYGFPLREHPATADVITNRGRRPGRGIVPHALRLDADEITHHASGFLVTTAPRTAVDCLAALPFGVALDLWAWVSTRAVLDVAALDSAIDRRRCWDGTEQLRHLRRVVASGAASDGEHRLHRLLRAAGLRDWQAAAPVYDEFGLIGIVDVLFQAAKVVLEVDGFRAHGSQQALVRDLRRQNRLTTAGYVVLRFTWSDIVDQPQEVLRQIRVALDSQRF